ncbi:MAG: hypothetical protein K2Z81_27075 [Cyanobacteria bacterium]|nr:hypothetical protein [Cyanobacteriota bacterium]
MPKKSKPSDSVRQLQFAKAKVDAAVGTAKLLAIIFGTIGIIVAIVFTLILSLIFGLNPPIAFLGSFVGCVIICLFVLPVKVLWRSKLAQICQGEGLWEEADQLVLADAGSSLDDILQGRVPREDNPNLPLALSQAQLIFIRKGETRKSLIISEYLSRNAPTDDGSYHSNTLSAIYVEVGRYQPGLAMLNDNLHSLETSGRKNSPAYTSALLSKAHAYVSLHRVDEAQKVLQELLESIEALNKEEIQDLGDRLVKSEVNRYEIDMAFYYNYLGKLKVVRNESDGEQVLRKSLEIMSNEHHQKLISLLYAEILLSLADLKVEQGDYKQGEELAGATLAYYENKTRYKGPDYHRARATRAYARLKQGYTDISGDMNACLDKLESDYEPVHPHIATVLTWIAESLISTNDYGPARSALERALSIRKELFSATDPEITEIEELLATQPELRKVCA